VVESTAESALVPLLLKNILQRTGPFMHTVILLLLVAFWNLKFMYFDSLFLIHSYLNCKRLHDLPSNRSLIIFCLFLFFSFWKNIK